MTSISIILLWLFCPLSKASPPTFSSSDLGKNTWPFPKISPVPLYHGFYFLKSGMILACSLPALQCYTTLLKRSIIRFQTQFREMIFKFSNYLIFLYLKKYFSVSANWENFYIWVLRSVIKVHTYFFNQYVSIKPSQLPSTLHVA